MQSKYKHTRGICAVILFLFTALSTQAQKEFYKGFVVKETGDTLKGQIWYRKNTSNPKRLIFRNEKDTLKLTPADLKAVMVVDDDNDTIFFRKEIVTYAPSKVRLIELTVSDSAILIRDTVLLELVMAGEQNLYLLKTYSYRTHFYIQSGDSAAKELVYRKYYAKYEDGPTAIVSGYQFQLLRAMGNCPGIDKQIAQLRYTEDDLKKIFKQYNNCFGKSSISYTRKPEKLRFHVTAFGGFVSTWTPYTAKDETNKPKAIRGNGFTAGYGFNVGLTRDMPKLWMHNEIGVTAFYLQGTTPRLYSNFTFYTKNLSINLLYLKLRVLPTYYFGKSYAKVNPYINVGFAAGFLMKELKNQAYRGNNTNSTEPAIPNVKKYDLGFAASLGLRIYKYAGIEVRYELGDGFSYNKGYGTITHSLLVTGRINIGEKPKKKPL